jgi:TolB protein
MKNILWLCTLVLVFATATFGERVYISISKEVSQKAPIVVASSNPQDIVLNKLISILCRDLSYSGFFSPALKSGRITRNEFYASGTRGAYGVFVEEKDNSINVLLVEFSKGETLINRAYAMNKSTRDIAHRIAGDIVFCLTGKPPIASSRIAFVSNRDGSYRIYAVDYDGENEVPLTSRETTGHFPRWMPDNRRIIFLTYQNGFGHLAFLDAFTGTVKVFLNCPGMNAFAAPSPDGTEFVASLSRSGNLELYLVGADGSIVRQITRNRCIDSSPAFSPDGGRIVFVSDRSGSPQVYMMNRDGTNVHRISYGCTYAVSPAWSPDGNFICFASRKGSSFVLELYDVQTGQKRSITPERDWYEDPSWAPDSVHIVCTRQLANRRSVWVINVFSGETRRLTEESSGDCFSPSWSY